MKKGPALRCLGLLVSAGQLILANYVYSSGPETFGLPDQPLEQEIVALARRVEALEKDLEECRASCTSREPIWITPVAPARDVDAHFSHRVGTTFRHRTVAPIGSSGCPINVVLCSFARAWPSPSASGSMHGWDDRATQGCRKGSWPSRYVFHHDHHLQRFNSDGH